MRITDEISQADSIPAQADHRQGRDASRQSGYHRSRRLKRRITDSVVATPLCDVFGERGGFTEGNEENEESGEFARDA